MYEYYSKIRWKFENNNSKNKMLTINEKIKNYKNSKIILQSAFATPSQFKLNNIINHINLKNTK